MKDKIIITLLAGILFTQLVPLMTETKLDIIKEFCALKYDNDKDTIYKSIFGTTTTGDEAYLICVITKGG